MLGCGELPEHVVHAAGVEAVRTFDAPVSPLSQCSCGPLW